MTTDGYLVFMADADLDVLDGAPITVVKDYDYENDSFVVRGRYVAAWLGADQKGSPMTMWSKSGGVVTNGPTANRLTLFPRGTVDAFAWYAPTTSLLKEDVRAMVGGTNALVLANLDSGLTAGCKPQVAWLPNELLVAGCIYGTTTPRIATYGADGTGEKKAILEGSAAGIFMDHARTHAVVQTKTASSIRALSGSGPPISLDTPIYQVMFTKDDAKLVYLRSDGKLRRATAATAAPVDLGNAIALLSITSDGSNAIVATKGDGQVGTDLVVVGTQARTLAPEKSVLWGISDDDSAAVYTSPHGVGLDGPLFIARLDGTPPVKLSDDASRVLFDGSTVYWQDFDAATKTNTLKAAKISAPGTTIQMDTGLDVFTAQVMIAGGKVYAGSKLGLWEYPKP